MGHPTPEDEERAYNNFKKMDSPEMQKLVNNFIKEFHIDGYRSSSIFGLAHSMFEQKKGAFSIIGGRYRLNDCDYFLNLINTNVCNKLAAMNYHFQNAKKFEQTIEEYSQQMIALGKKLEIDRPITTCLSTAKLQIEYEAFILQCRACLDHFIFSVSYYFGIETPSIDSLKKELKNRAESDNIANKVLSLLNSSDQFNDVLKSRSGACISDWSDREKIAHGGRLSLRPLNVTINPMGESKILLVARPNSTKVVDEWFTLPSLTVFMESTRNQLVTLIESVYTVILTWNGSKN